MKIFKFSAISLFLLLSSVPWVYGEAFRNLHQGTAATGQGDAFAAQADDPSALFYNPAGMTQLERVQLYTGTLLVGGNYHYTSPAGQKFDGTLDGTIASPPPSYFYLTANLNQFNIGLLKDFTVGVGLNSPFGLLIRWPDDIPFSEIDVFGTLPLLDIKPTLAYKVNDYLSIGGGLDIYTFASFLGEGQVEVQASGQGINFPPGALVEVNGDDTAVGFNVGALLTLWRTEGKPRLNLAFVYRSQKTLKLEGEILLNGNKLNDTIIDLKLPQIFTWGVALWPIRSKTNEWKVEVDLDYVDWGSFENTDVRDAGTKAVQLPQPRNWDSVFVIKVGTEYKWLNPVSLPYWDFALRAGYIRSETPVPNFTFEPLIPDGDFNGFSVGLGMLCKGNAHFLGMIPCENSITKSIGLDVTYVNQLYESRTISNNRQDLVNGKYDTALHAGGIGVRINF
jgi:long-chain fatty acid transport protein